MNPSTLVLIVDPQNDFCDLPAGTDSISGQLIFPSLPVPGAHADMRRLASWLDENADHIDDIVVTLDSHQYFDIAHPDCWRTGQGGEVTAFTAITAASVRSGQFRTADPALQAYALNYLEALEARGRYTHMVWPVHCQLGSWGHGIHHAVLGALERWQRQRQRAAMSVIKGTNPYTEHYSALQAEVPDPQDPSTQLNMPLLERIAAADQVVIAGEASSHCVAYTVRDLFAHLPAENLKPAAEVRPAPSCRGEKQKRHLKGAVSLSVRAQPRGNAPCPTSSLSAARTPSCGCPAWWTAW